MKFELEDGTKCTIITTCKNKDTGIKYIVYTDGTKDVDGQEKVYASRFNEKDGEYTLLAIESDKEWDYIDDILAKMGE